MTSNTGGGGFVQLHFNHMTGWEQKGKAPQAPKPDSALGVTSTTTASPLQKYTFISLVFFFFFFSFFKPFLAWVTQDNISSYNTDLVLIYTQQTYKLLKKNSMKNNNNNNNTTTTWPHVPCSSAPVVSTFVPQIHPLACRRGWEGAVGDAGGMRCLEPWNPRSAAQLLPGLDFTHIYLYLRIFLFYPFSLYIYTNI